MPNFIIFATRAAAAKNETKKTIFFGENDRKVAKITVEVEEPVFVLKKIRILISIQSFYYLINFNFTSIFSDFIVTKKMREKSGEGKKVHQREKIGKREHSL